MSKQVSNREPIGRAIAYIDRCYSESVKVEALARLADYSVARFRCLFRERVGMAPSKYVMQTRIRAARRLLRTTAKRVSDIAAETGFYDQAHFIRAFRAHNGLTPLQYRAREGAPRIEVTGRADF